MNRMRAVGAGLAVAWQVMTGVALGGGLVALLMLSVPFTILIWLAIALFLAGTKDVFTSTARREDLALVWFGVRWATATTAASGLFAVFGSAAVVPIAAILVSSPAALHSITRGRFRTPPASKHQVPVSALSETSVQWETVETDALTVSDAVTDDDLCLSWRSSYVALTRAVSPEARLRVVRFRALVLDELERRDAAGLRAWLLSGARAAGDPRPHLS